MKSFIAEFFGTFWLVLGGCGSAVLAAAFPEVGIGLLGVALILVLFNRCGDRFARLSARCQSDFPVKNTAGRILK